MTDYHITPELAADAAKRCANLNRATAARTRRTWEATHPATKRRTIVQDRRVLAVSRLPEPTAALRVTLAYAEQVA